MKIYDVKVHNSWDTFLISSKYFSDMCFFIEHTKNISPKKEKVFRFLENNLNETKCIILGMDPYPSDVATGRAFEVANIDNFTDRYKQSSLSKIFKTLWYLKYNEILSISELREKANTDTFKYMNIHNWYDAMEKDGVIFLNATLTTLLGKANSHTKIWEPFMDELIKYIVKTNENIKWLIWGQNALDRVEGLVDNKNIIYSCHPASRTNNNFVEDCCFKKVKNVLWVE